MTELPYAGGTVHRGHQSLVKDSPLRRNRRSITCHSTNVVVVLLDDAGFGTAFIRWRERHLRSTGIADTGLQGTTSSTTALCSADPRAALLTGRNHHQRLPWGRSARSPTASGL